MRRHNAAAEDFGGLTLVKIKFLAYLGDVVGIDIGGVHLALKQADQLAVSVAVFTVQNDFAASGAKVSLHRWDSGRFALVGVGR